jgi:hypothetical protein
MKIGGDYRVHPYRNTWEKAAGELGLDEDAVLERVVHLARAAPDAFADAANAPDVVALGRPLPQQLIDLVADRAERCLALLPESSKSRASRTMNYEERLLEMSDAVPPQPVSAYDAPALVRSLAQALREALAAEPRDLSVVREHIAALGIAALQAIYAVEGAESAPGYVKPTRDRLARAIGEYAPNIANLPIPQEDPVAGVAGEIIRAASRYADANPKSIFGAADERLRALYRVVGLAARALSL